MRQNMEDRVSVMSDPRTNAKMIDDLLQEANGKLYYVPRDHSNFTPPCREQGAKCYGRAVIKRTDFGYGSSSQATYAFCARVSANKLRIAITRGPAKSGSPGR